MAHCGNIGPAGDPCILLPDHPSLWHVPDKGDAWPNAEAVARQQRQPTRKSGGSKLADLADRVPKPIVRADDPVNSHIAAAHYEPTRKSAKGRVLLYLQDRLGEWIDAVDLTAPEVGGFAGTRRLRELRDAGYNIQTREKPGSRNIWQHRLVSD